MQEETLQSVLQENPTATGTALLRRRHMPCHQAQRGEFCAFADELKVTPPSDAKPRGSSGGYQARKAQCTWKQPPCGRSALTATLLYHSHCSARVGLRDRNTEINAKICPNSAKKYISLVFVCSSSVEHILRYKARATE